jgi:predicted transcriptional regulator
MTVNTDAMLTRLVRRYAYIRPQNLETFADRVIAVSGHPEIPREPELIFETFGIELIIHDLHHGHAGHWQKTPDGYRVYINRHEEPSRRRFTAFHEMFEIIYSLPAFPRGTLDETQLHRMADLFSVAVLMPTPEIIDMAKALHHPDVDTSGVLADRFGVSYSAMRIRLRELGLSKTQEAW